MESFNCTFTNGLASSEATVSVGIQALEIRSNNSSVLIDYADIRDFRLINYHLIIYTYDNQFKLSKLGLNTENVFNKLWEAYNARSRESLFIKNPIQECECDYSYSEGELTRRSKATAALYHDSLCILPHDDGARRIPLCFADEPKIEGYSLSVSLDTGENYSISRLGHDTQPFFERLCQFRNQTVASWQQAQLTLERNINSRLGEMQKQYDDMQALGVRVICGLFSPEDDAFWFAAVGNGRAAVELAIGEKAATYLYNYSVSDDVFQLYLRHAMEAVGSNREVIYVSDDVLPDKPLYRMAIMRSRHVRFLREHNSGRIIHNGSWNTHLQEFFGR